VFAKGDGGFPRGQERDWGKEEKGNYQEKGGEGDDEQKKGELLKGEGGGWMQKGKLKEKIFFPGTNKRGKKTEGGRGKAHGNQNEKS